MISFCKENLAEIQRMLGQLPDSAYNQPATQLSGASIGQHVRHILEFYVCLLHGAKAGRVNYDKRERNTRMETDIAVAMGAIARIQIELKGIKEDCSIELEGDFGHAPDGKSRYIVSSLYRELAYNLEHAIHHQALIKIGLIELKLDHLLSDYFGIAPATIRYKAEQEERMSIPG